MNNQNAKKEKKYKGISGAFTYPLANKEILLENNKFAKYSLEELKEIFDRYRFFCTNGYTPEDVELDKVRKELCEEIPYGVVVMQNQLLTAIAVKTFLDD